MRKDMILGMSIGGIVLAIVVVYLTVSPSHKAKTQVQLDTGGAVDAQGADNDPQTASDRGIEPTGPSLPRPTAHTGTDSGGGEAAGSLDAAPPSPAPAATEGDRRDPVWGKKLYGTPLIATGQTPGNTEQTSGGDQGSTVTPPRETVAIADHLPPAPGEISTGTLGTRSAAAATPTTHPADPAGAKYTQHRVQPGESFSSIAAAAYGSASYFPHILRANPGLDPRKLKVGMTINLPLESQVKPTEPPAGETPTLAAISPGAPATPAVAKAAPVAIDKSTQYQVKSGDNLNRISIKLYGKITMVQPIYEANKATIGPDMAKLKLGMILKLPEPPTVK